MTEPDDKKRSEYYKKLTEYLIAEVESYMRSADDQFAPPDKRPPTTRQQLAASRKVIRDAIRFVKARLEEELCEN